MVGRRQLLGLIVLTAVLLCCLAAGTPVNNDPSPAAEVAGIHLTAHPSVARAAAADVAPLLARSMVAALLGATTYLVVVGVRRLLVDPLDELVWARSGTRRGPPFARS